MFSLVTLQDNIRVEPSELGKSHATAVTDVIKLLYFDKVIPGVGLVVTLYDLLEVGSGAIPPSDGAVHFRSKFRLVVFCPFEGEVLIGKLLKSTEAGIRASMGFFSDVLIPVHALQSGSSWEPAEQVWVWLWEGNQMFMDEGETLRFRVSGVRFNNAPRPTDQLEGGEPRVGTAENPFMPMEVLGDMSEDGLGLVQWWSGGEGGEAEEAEEAEEAPMDGPVPV